MMLKNIAKYKRYAFLFILFLISILYFPQSASAGYTLTILHTNDLHSHLDKFPRLFSVIEKIKKEKKGEDILLLDSGDFMIGTLYHLLTKTSSPELTLMHTLGYDATCLGNHEFDWGCETLAKIITTAEKNKEGKTVPIVASNICFNLFDDRDDALEKLYKKGIIKPYLIKTLSNGQKVGIIGILGKEAEEEAPGVPPAGFIHSVEFIRQKVNALREKDVDILICLSHSGIKEDKKLAKSVKGIDIIIAGHCHTALFKPVHAGNTLILEAGSYADYLGKLEVFVENGKVEVRDYRLIPIDENIPEDPSLQKTVAEYRDIIDKKILSPFSLEVEYDKIMAEVDFNLTLEGETTPESNLGYLVADAILFVATPAKQKDPVDFAFQP
ncbi:metallophosphatase, partial [Candidatus Aerophobetes bacterium]|nr:metallophosphatase [Candidatus Aerophobetes bacterium]